MKPAAAVAILLTSLIVASESFVFPELDAHKSSKVTNRLIQNKDDSKVSAN